MKKFFIFFLILTFSSNAFGGPAGSLYKFNKWLFDNGHHQYVEIIESEVCKQQPKFSNLWYYNKCDQPQYKNNLDIKLSTRGGGNEINYHDNPNFGTLLFYVFHYLEDTKGFGRYLIEPSKNPIKFNSDLRDDKFVKKQLQTKAILSYLYFENDKIIIDEISPEDRFGIIFKNDTKWSSMSMGKSLVSYVTGHAICGGYIDSIDSTLNDWPLIKDTLYSKKKIN